MQNRKIYQEEATVAGTERFLKRRQRLQNNKIFQEEATVAEQQDFSLRRQLMSIRVRLDRIMLERKVSLTELAEKVGITMANLSILKSSKAKAIRFSTLDAICRYLQCQPGDILEWEPGAPEEDEP